MDVLFLNPPTVWGSLYVREGRCQQAAGLFVPLTPQITLASAAALLESKGFAVGIKDCMAEAMQLGSFFRYLRAARPALVIINVSTPTFDSDAEVARRIRAMLPGVKIAAVGVHVTALPAESLASGAFDFCVRGEIELPVLALAESVLGGGSVSGVPSVSFLKKGRVCNNPSCRPADLDSLPLPARELLPAYFFALNGRSFTSIIYSRGCPNRCAFCVAPSFHGSMPRYRSAASVVDEIKRVVGSLGVRHFLLYGENVTADNKRLMDVCAGIKKEGLDISWMCNSRVDTVSKGLLAAMASSGCSMVSFGVESASQAVLDTCHKGTTPAQARRAIGLARSAGIATVGHFVLGLPGETRPSCRDTVSFSLSCGLDFAEYYLATPFPGSALYSQASRRAPWRDFEYSKPAFGALPGLERARRQAYFRFYARPSSLVNLVRIFGLKRIPWLLSRGFSALVYLGGSG